MAWSPSSFADLSGSIKAHFLQGRYRQCISLCTQAMDSGDHESLPLRTTFLYFYAALSYEALARSMYNHSQMLEPTLAEAEYCFSAADESLPLVRAASPPHERDGVFDDFISAGFTISPKRGSTASSVSVSSHGADVSYASSATSMDTHGGQAKVDGALDEPLSWPDYEHQQHCDDGLDVFHQMLQNHIRMLQTLRVSKLAKRDVESGPFADGTPHMHRTHGMDVEMNGCQRLRMAAGEKHERIRKGRERGWKRERFDAEKYQTLCNAALSELYAAPGV